MNYKRLITEPDPKLRSLLKQGRIKFVIMDFPIHGRTDFLAHKMLYFSKDPQQFFSLVQFFLREQNSWFEAKDPQECIENYAQLLGVTASDISYYRRDKSIIPILEKNANRYLQVYKINAAPTTIVELSNKQISLKSPRFVGVVSCSLIADAVQHLLDKKH